MIFAWQTVSYTHLDVYKRQVLDGEPRFVDLTYRDQDTPVVTFDEEWQNNRQKIKVTVLKKAKDTDRMLEGAIFGLFTKEEIKSRDGKVLMEAGTLIEQKTTDENGQILFKADLPVDGTYIVKEIYAPDGFVKMCIRDRYNTAL